MFPDNTWQILSCVSTLNNAVSILEFGLFQIPGDKCFLLHFAALVHTSDRIMRPAHAVQPFLTLARKCPQNQTDQAQQPCADESIPPVVVKRFYYAHQPEHSKTLHHEHQTYHRIP